MNAIKVTRQNMDYVKEYVIKNAPWAADFENIMDHNIATNGEWTYVYSVVRGEGEDAKTMLYTMTESRFHEIFQFTEGECPFLVMPITRK